MEGEVVLEELCWRGRGEKETREKDKQERRWRLGKEREEGRREDTQRSGRSEKTC